MNQKMLVRAFCLSKKIFIKLFTVLFIATFVSAAILSSPALAIVSKNETSLVLTSRH